MRNTELRTCDLSSNVIKKIPPKFSIKFSLITGTNIFQLTCNFCIFAINLKEKNNLFDFDSIDLNISNNQINKLPDEFASLTQLLRLDISHNLFLSLPRAVFKMPKLRQLKANNNAIIGKLRLFLNKKIILILTLKTKLNKIYFSFWQMLKPRRSSYPTPLKWLICAEIRSHHNVWIDWSMPKFIFTSNYLNASKKNGKILMIRWDKRCEFFLIVLS